MVVFVVPGVGLGGADAEARQVREFWCGHWPPWHTQGGR
jgi:hypothetical protein